MTYLLLLSAVSRIVHVPAVMTWPILRSPRSRQMDEMLAVMNLAAEDFETGEVCGADLSRRRHRLRPRGFDFRVTWMFLTVWMMDDLGLEDVVAVGVSGVSGVLVSVRMCEARLSALPIRGSWHDQSSSPGREIL